MTVSIMNDGIGEQKLRDRRKRFWRMVRQGMWLGAGIGVVIGLVTGFSEARGDVGGWIGWVVWPALIVSTILFVRYARTYFERIDELDLQDNLWASLIGLYAFVVAYPCWWVLEKIGQLPAPDAGILWGVAMVAATIAYGWRKLRHRI